MSEVDEASKLIASSVDPDANIIFGATIDEQMVDQIKITVVATGFDEAKRRLANLSNNVEYKEPVQQVPTTVIPNIPDQNPADEDKWDIPAFLRQGKN